jgi:hypothetical protein
MRLLDRDVVHVAPSGLDGDDLVVPGLLLEPASTADVLPQCLSLAHEPEADRVREAPSRRSHHVDMPAAVAHPSPAAEDPVVEQQELALLGERVARGTQDDAPPSRVAVAIEVGAEEGPHHRLRGPKDEGRYLLEARARPFGDPERLDEKVGERLRVEKDAPPAAVLLDRGAQAEESTPQAREALSLRQVTRGEAEMALYPAQVAVADQVAQE